MTSPKRSPVLPDVPTLQEAGLAVTAVVAYGLTAPARTPEPVLARLRQARRLRVTSDKAVADHFGALGIEASRL